MSLNKLFCVLLTVLAAGCASTSKDRHMDALRDLELDFDVLVAEKDGLTKRGCRVFFPDVEVAECHAEWHKRNLDGKLTYLQEKGSPTMRGVWQGGRNAAYAELLRDKTPKMTAAEINAELAKLGDDIPSCSKQADTHLDECLFMLAQIATPSEVFAANQTAVRLEAEARAQQRMMMRHALHSQTMRMNTYRPMPPIRRK